MKEYDYDVVIIGAGLSGLTSGLYLQEAGLRVLILERAPQAGGLTTSWQVHGQGEGEGKEYVKKYLKEEDLMLQYPMHMVFKNKYPNLIDVYKHLGIHDANLTPPIKEFNIVDSDSVKHNFKMEDNILPAPFHALKTVFNLKMGIVDKLSFLLSGLPILYLGQSLNRRNPKDSFWDRVSMEAMLKRFWMTEKARDFASSYVPSIYNLDAIEVNARRMAAITFGTIFTKNGLWYQLVNDNYITGTIEPHVNRFLAAGGTIKVNCEVRRIVHNENEVEKILFKDLNDGIVVVCTVCGCKQLIVDEGFCKKCGHQWTTRLSTMRVPTNLYKPQPQESIGDNLIEVNAKYCVAAVRGHQLLPMIDIDSPLRSHQYFQNLGREKGACLSIARIFYDKKITDEKFITGTSRRAFTFNGCQDIGNIMSRYSKYPGSVIDVLADRAESLQILPMEKFLEDVVKDLARVWPEAKDAEVKLALGAHIKPSVLYHKEVPRLPGERNRFVDTPLQNLFACNCSLGLIGIGMESAYQSGKMVANKILEAETKQTVHVYGEQGYKIGFLLRIGYKIIDTLVKARSFLGKIITSV